MSNELNQKRKRKPRGRKSYPRKKATKVKSKLESKYDPERKRELLEDLLAEDEIFARIYAFEGIYSHICEQIEFSKEGQGKYRRREMIRLQIAKEKIEFLLEEGKDAAKEMGLDE